VEGSRGIIKERAVEEAQRAAHPGGPEEYNKMKWEEAKELARRRE
jgi:hypothetical protein